MGNFVVLWACQSQSFDFRSYNSPLWNQYEQRKFVEWEQASRNNAISNFRRKFQRKGIWHSIVIMMNNRLLKIPTKWYLYGWSTRPSRAAPPLVRRSDLRLFFLTPPYLLVPPHTKYENIILSFFSPLGFENN